MMKAILFFSIMLIGCSVSSRQSEYDYADQHDFSRYAGKIVQSAKYCDYDQACEGINGHTIIITFTDGTKLKIYAYKYTPHIYK